MKRNILIGVIFLLLGILSLFAVVAFFVPGLIIGAIFIIIALRQFITVFRNRNNPNFHNSKQVNMFLYTILIITAGFLIFCFIRLLVIDNQYNQIEQMPVKSAL